MSEIPSTGEGREARREGRRRRAAIAALSLVAVGFAPWTLSRADPPQEIILLNYDVRWGPFRLMSIESRTVLGDERYEMGMKVRTEGMVGWFVDWSSRVETQGVLVADRPRPVRRVVSAEYEGAHHGVTIEYGKEGPLRVDVAPDLSSEGLVAVDPELRVGTIDPETATLLIIRRNAAGQPCTGVEQVFDGRLRYDLELADAGSRPLELTEPIAYAGPARLCDATVRPVAGYPREHPERWGAGMRFRYWLAPVLAGAPPIPVRMEVKGERGTLEAHLRDARIVSSAAAPESD